MQTDSDPPAGGALSVVSIVVPAFNEAANLALFVAAMGAAMSEQHCLWKIVFVDDGSRDGTWPTIESLAAQDTRVHGIRLLRNFGKEAAIEAGLKESASADACIVMDADLQHPPNLVPRMLQAWSSGNVDVVSGLKAQRQDESALRRTAARLFYWIFRAITGIDLAQASDFKLLSRRAVESYLWLPEKSKFFRGLTPWMGYPETCIEFEVADRADGTASRWSFGGLLRYGWSAVLSFSGMPLRLPRYLATAMALLAIVLGAQTVILKARGDAVEGFTTVILLMLVIGSTILFVLGVMGDYFERIFMEIKGRPSYLIGSRTPGKADK